MFGVKIHGSGANYFVSLWSLVIQGQGGLGIEKFRGGHG